MAISIALEKEVYYAGETIIGKVELTQKESVKINNNVTIRIHGYAEVFGSMGSTGSRTDYLNKSSVLVVRSWKEALYSGNFSIPFHFDIPSTLPSTFNHPNCKIIYFLDLKYDEVAEIKPKVEKQVVIINKVDLNMEYGLRSPFTQKSTMKQPFEYSLTTNRRAYLSGDVIQVKASITNNSDVDLDHVPICLIESVSLWTKRGTFEINRVVACASFPARVRKRETESGRMRIRVPAVWPSSNDRCNIIDCTYYLAVVTKPADVANKPLDKPLPISQNAFDGESRIPILIGTVGYKEDTMAPPPYTETNQNGDELPMYAEVEAAENASLNGVTVELDSKRLTLPAIVPDLNKAGWSIGGLFGSVLRVCRD